MSQNEPVKFKDAIVTNPMIIDIMSNYPSQKQLSTVKHENK